jgi:hypothetical protein
VAQIKQLNYGMWSNKRRYSHCKTIITAYIVLHSHLTASNWLIVDKINQSSCGVSKHSRNNFCYKIKILDLTV